MTRGRITSWPTVVTTRDPTARWWGVEHICGGEERTYPTLHWADEPEIGAGPRVAFECEACGDRFAFYEVPA